MKRIGNLYPLIYSIENLQLADKRARKGKRAQYGVIQHDKNRAANILEIQRMLIDKTFVNSEYSTFLIHEPKEREVFRLPYCPDRIIQHAIMNVLQPIFVSTFTSDTYSCIKGRGIHAASKAMKAALKDVQGTQYCLKLDVKKFYPSVDHDILKKLIRRKIKDKDLLWLLDIIIDSAPGLPIGNYLSQYFANFYLTYFDHYVKEVLGVKYYFRYADDIVVLSSSKAYLHELLATFNEYLTVELNLDVKGNYQVFPVDARSVDFLGYRYYHTHTLLRKSIKQSFARSIAKKKNKQSIAAYQGWAKHCNSKHLLKKLLYEEI